VFDRSFRARPKVAVTELPSFLLEHFSAAPTVSVVTNVQRDHLNRYDGMKGYARTKAAIFTEQSERQHLILNADDEWMPFFLKQEPCAKVWTVSVRPLDEGKGLYIDGDDAWFLSERGLATRVLPVRGLAERHGRHALSNFLAAALAAHLSGCPWPVIAKRMTTLPDVPFRQEVVHRTGKLVVINDTCATSPDGAIAAVERWGGPNCMLIAGGTDRDLEYDAWAKAVVRHVKPENTFLLAGTATDKMRRALKRSVRGRRTFDTLDRCMEAAFARAGTYVNSVVLFSPGAKSFGPFKHEFDRGQTFNKLLKRFI
jgi:UDP-N-acetylmuramoylalanine--D-glutamate ligase